jgi:hypothetical protein
MDMFFNDPSIRDVLTSSSSGKSSKRHHHHHHHHASTGATAIAAKEVSEKSSSRRHHHHHSSSSSKHDDEKRNKKSSSKQHIVQQQQQFMAAQNKLINLINSRPGSAKCIQCNLYSCGCEYGTRSSFVDDGSWMDHDLYQVDSPYGFINGFDTAAYTFTQDPVTKYVTATPIIGQPDLSGLGPSTQPEQTFFIGSTTANDPALVAWGLFSIASLPSATNSSYILKPKEMVNREGEAGQFYVNDIIRILYQAPIVKPGISGDDIYTDPNAADTAQMFQITAIDAVTGFWTLAPVGYSTLKRFHPVHTKAIC